MVKGLSKRVVTVRFPESNVFEQAIFLVRDEQYKGLSSGDVVTEACTIAEKYTRKQPEGKHRRLKPAPLPSALYVIIGASAVGIAWAATELLPRLFG